MYHLGVIDTYFMSRERSAMYMSILVYRTTDCDLSTLCTDIYLEPMLLFMHWIHFSISSAVLAAWSCGRVSQE